jgi:flavin-dependent dehydrogenase
MVKSDPAIHSRLAKARIRDKIVGWPLVTFNPRLPVIANRVALIGDAAGLINPLSGEGIQYALRSARWCAETLLDALSSDALSLQGLLPFARRVETEMRYDMALSRFIVDLVTNRPLNPLWLSALAVIAKKAASDSDYCNLAAGLFAGLVPARQFLALPFFWRAAKSTAMTFGIAALEMLRRPLGQETRRATDTQTIPSMFKDSASHPVATIKWCRDCGLSALELAAQMATSAR